MIKKKYKIIILCVILTTMMFAIPASVEVDNMEAIEKQDKLAGNNGNILLTADEQVVTQKDIQKEYSNYADEEATLIINASIEDNNVNVVGMVFDIEDDRPIANASISVAHETIVTDENGRFQILDMPAGTYNWEIKTEGYQDATYSNYELDAAGGANIFTFYLSKNKRIQQNGTKIEHDHEINGGVDISNCDKYIF